MTALQPVRGTRDILPEEMRRHRAVVETAREIAERYGYLEMSTPVFEFTEVFRRTLGETSDIVTKEMYSFAMKEGEELTLRPEATAGVARCFISGGMMQQLPLKFFCSGPMFRHERPQKGRQRQFHQIDVELLGVGTPAGDIEVIALAAHILDALGVLESTTLELNTLGDPESRKRYRAELVAYFRDHKDRLSRDSLDRLERNPLRILDSKDKGDRAVIAGAPFFADYLNSESADYFEAVRQGLSDLGIAYEVQPRLVRGLDYYTHTAFEFTTTKLGAQGAVLAGGRYDGLIETMGGPPTPGIGWAAGIERLALLLEQVPAIPRPIAVVPVGEAAQAIALRVTDRLRHAGFHVDLGFSGNLGKRMKRA
ncbi:MAG TPA: histidine--tRNA ligase, partial [Kiloniellales bacterium]|nr:histidine--tRNA ligase [Kiloniellales bacterium]